MHLVLVHENRKISSSSAVIRFQLPRAYKAGQVVNVTIAKDMPPRMYSILSAESAGFYEILYKVIPEGKLTPQLKNLIKGDEIFVSDPFGSFLASSEKVFLIATGTGIAPFHSMIQSNSFKEIILLHGSRTRDDFYFQDLFKDKLDRNYVQCYTGPEATNLYKGRVTNYLEEIDPPVKDYKYYLCGSAEMVVDTREILIKKGIPFQKILSEIYF